METQMTFKDWNWEAHDHEVLHVNLWRGQVTENVW